MRLEDYQKVSVEQFMGLYKRGLDDECPRDHAKDCPNVVFEPGQVSTRSGLSKSLILGHTNVARFFLATFNDTTLNVLTGDGVSKIYKGTDAVALLTIAGMTDFAALNIFNKCYISPSSGGAGLAGAVLQVWDGTNAVRPAAGPAPSAAGSMTAADGAAGDIDAGVHLFAVVYLTNTGFQTPPGPKIGGVFSPTSYTAPGGKKCNLSNVPIGPSYVTKRIIIGTKAGEKEYFFIPFGTINDNVTTTITVNFFDSDLVISADYLFDLLETIPAGVGLAKYHGRMLIWGGEGDLVRVSLSGDPESFSNVDGFIQLPAERDGNTVHGSCQLRDVLYFSKFPGIYATEDNFNVPSTWRIVTIDGGVGSFYYGISTITASQPALAANDFFLLADRNGLFLFDGVVRRPELTWKIRDTWQRFTHGQEFNITTFVDPFNNKFYVLLPVDGSLTPNLLLAADFAEGLSHDKVKWSIWTFPFTITAIAMVTFADISGFDYFLRLGSTGSTVYKLDPTKTDDDGVVITSYYDNGLLTLQPGFINFFRYLRFRVTGIGSLTLTLTSEDGAGVVSPPTLALSTTPGSELQRQINFRAEKMGLKFAGRFTMNRFDLFGKVRWRARPG